MTDMTACAADLIYLVSCAVNKRIPDRGRVQQMELEGVYQLSVYQSLTALAAYALESADMPDPRFTEAKAKSMRHIVLLDTERRRVMQQLEAEGIWHLPLKGAILKDDYPAYGLREMGDNDILCDPERMADVKAIMEKLGFTCTRYDNAVHDNYLKKPSIVFEMHRALFMGDDAARLQHYYDDVQPLLIREKGSFACRFSPEDFYVFLLAHEFKHCNYAGTGLRSLLDIYVYLTAHESELQQDIVADKLKRCGLTDFERTNRELAMRTFQTGEADEETLRELNYYLTSGTFGNEEYKNYYYLTHAMGGDDSASAKLKQSMRFLFYDKDVISEKYPFFEKHKVLLPALFIYRLFRALLLHPKRAFQPLKRILIYKKWDEND